MRVNRSGSRGRVQGVHTPPPTCDDLLLSNKSGILQNMHMCMICIFSSSHYVIACSKAFFFVFAFKICLRHQSLTPLLSLHPLLRKLLDPPLVKTIEITRLMIRMMSQFVFLCLLHLKLKFHWKWRPMLCKKQQFSIVLRPQKWLPWNHSFHLSFEHFDVSSTVYKSIGRGK